MKKKIFLSLFLGGLIAASRASAAILPCVGLKCTFRDFYVLAAKIIDFMLYGVAMPVTVILIIMGGFKLMMSQGSSAKLQEAKKAITAAIVGLAISLGAWIIVGTIIQALCVASAPDGSAKMYFVPWKTIESCTPKDYNIK